jgi:hypothetical protein
MLLAVAIGSVFILAIIPIANLYSGFTNELEFIGLLVGSIGALFGTIMIYFINRRYSGDFASTLFVLFLIILSIFVDEPYQVAHGRGILTFVLPIVIASVLLRPWSGFAVGITTSFIIVVLSLIIGERVPNISGILTLFLVGLITWISSRSLNQSNVRIRQLNSTLQDRL